MDSWVATRYYVLIIPKPSFRRKLYLKARLPHDVEMKDCQMEIGSG